MFKYLPLLLLFFPQGGGSPTQVCFFTSGQGNGKLTTGACPPPAQAVPDLPPGQTLAAIGTGLALPRADGTYIPIVAIQNGSLAKATFGVDQSGKIFAYSISPTPSNSLIHQISKIPIK